MQVQHKLQHLQSSLFIFFYSSNEFTDLLHRKEAGAQLVGSFTVEIGDQDEAGMNYISSMGLLILSSLSFWNWLYHVHVHSLQIGGLVNDHKQDGKQ